MKKQNNEVAVGIFVIVGFILVTMVLFFISGVYLFRQGYSLKVLYEYVSILDKGAPVRMAGVRIGEVSKVRLYYDEAAKKNLVEVKLFIEKGVQIKENYEFKIQGTHILSEPHIEITPVTSDAPFLANGAMVQGMKLVAVEDLIDRAHEIADEIAAILGSFRDGIEGEGAANGLKTMVKNLSDLSEALNTSVRGSETELRQSMKNIEASSASLDAILNQVERGEGTLGKLLMNDELYEEMRALVKDIRAHPWKLVRKDSASKKRFFFF